MLRKRSRAREVALQLLVWHDLNPGSSRASLEGFARDRLADSELETFALTLFDGVRRNGLDIDSRLSKAAEHWRLHRMASVDRNVLRLGTCELLHHADTPANVTLNEAIELARRFGSADSPGFVNGVLDRVNKDIAR